MKTAGLYGTPPVGPQRLSHAKNPSVLTVSLFPLEDGGIGTALLTETASPTSLCVGKLGWATATATWMSNGTLVCRWDGTKFEYVPTALGSMPTGAVRGIWAANDDDVWIVGESVPQGPGFPTTGFAAHRTKNTGGSPKQ